MRPAPSSFWHLLTALVILLAATQCARADDVVSALAVASFQQMDLSDTHEQARVIVRTAEGGYYATPVSRQQEGSFRLHVLLRPGETLAAILHTHPGTGVIWDRSGEFSPDDVDTATRLRIPSYVFFAKLQQVRVFVPGYGERLVTQYTR